MSLPTISGFTQNYQATGAPIKGNSSVIYRGYGVSKNNKVWMKLANKKDDKLSRIENEWAIMKTLNGDSGHRGIPSVIDYNAGGMVTNPLGKNVQLLFIEQKPKQFSNKTVVQIALQMFNIIEYIHSMKIVHLDIRPENFYLPELNVILEDNDGYGKNLLYLVDYGFAKKYVDEQGNQITHTTKGTRAGTARYASVNAHQKGVLSRRDDLETLGYVWVYLLTGTLPWIGLGQKNTTQEQNLDLIFKKKLEVTIEQLCDGCPNEFVSYFRYIKNLKLTDIPDYDLIRKLLSDLYDQNICDNIYDWDASTKN